MPPNVLQITRLETNDFLGLNHVVRKWSEAVSRTASMLLAVPGGTDGPSGVLIVGENWVAYKHEGHEEVRTALPRREGYPSSRGLLVTACATHKQRDLFFFLLQTEAGDLYKCTLDYEGDVVRQQDRERALFSFS